jgi:hypothetical protein
MLRQFIFLEWRAFFRSASFASKLAFKIIAVLGFLYFAFIFSAAGIGLFYGIKKTGQEPLMVINTFLFYYWAADLVFRFLLQNMPVTNIRPLLYLPMKKAQVVHFSLGKTAVSFFNLIHAFFFIPFSVVLWYNGYDFMGILQWHLGILLLIFASNFINLLANNKLWLTVLLGALTLGLGALHYYQIFDVTQYTKIYFENLFHGVYAFPLTALLLVLVYAAAFTFFRKNMYLDAGLSVKHQEADGREYTFLNRFGTLGSFLKNDLRLILRNKRSKTTIMVSVMFLFYGLLFFTNSIEAYENPMWKIFAGMFVSGGFLFTFGQFVPSWDSAYYPLMMSQNIKYREYLTSKWWLVVIATAFSTVLATFYLYFGWEAYLAVLTGAVYNIGVNAHLVLWGGAYIKQPIDLASSKQAFGNKQAFNSKTMLLSIPKLILPLVIFAAGYYTISPMAGYLFVILFGISGLAFRDKVFAIIEKVYKTEKYKTLAAYKEKG